MKKCQDCKKEFELRHLSLDGLCPECLYDANARILGWQPLTVAALLESEAKHKAAARTKDKPSPGH